MRFLAPLFVAFLLSGCSAGSSLLAVDPPAELSDFEPAFEVDTLWARQLGKGVDKHFIKLSPLVERDHVYAANHKGRVEAYVLPGGERLWRTEVAAAISGGPGDGGDLLLVGGDAEVIALNKSDGAIRWRVPVSSEVLAAPAYGNGVVVVHTVDGALYGLDAGDGHHLWRYSQEVPLLTLRGVGEPQIVSGIVVAGFANGRLVALTLQDGRVIWEAALSVPRGRTELERMVDVDANLMIRDGVVYAAGYQGRIAALTLDSGRLLWTREFSTYSGIAVAGRDVYVTDAAGNLWALARSNGGTLWKQGALHGRQLSPPAVQGGTVVLADYAGYVHWLSRDDGHLMARARIEDWETLFPVPPDTADFGYKEDRAVLEAPRVFDDYVYALDKRGTLDAFRVLPTQP